MEARGLRVAAITAKDKLRRTLGHGLRDGICFSAEKAKECTMGTNGIEDVEAWIGRAAPGQYSSDLSLFVLDAGVKLLEEGRADFLYLTLQYKYAPGSKEDDGLMAAIDSRLSKLAAYAVIGVTGDHGMSGKANEAEEPNVLFLEDVLNEKLGSNAARVICPITDPFVRHHGALGSFVGIYLKVPTHLDHILSFCNSFPEVEVALSGQDAARIYDMPVDREGDIVVIAEKDDVIGGREVEHYLSKLGIFRCVRMEG